MAGTLVECVDVERRVGRRVAQIVDDRVEVRLAGAAAHGGDGCIGDVHAGVRSLQHGGRVQAAGVVRVEVNGDGDFFAKGADELESSVGLAQAGHVLDG